jgi:hypothetical protein
MTQVLTVSPPTAAIVSDAYKTQMNPKAMNVTPLEEAIEEWHAKAVADGDIADRPLLEFVHPPSLALTFLTAAHSKVPQTTPEQATAAYLANGK